MITAANRTQKIVGVVLNGAIAIRKSQRDHKRDFQRESKDIYHKSKNKVKCKTQK